MATNAGLAACLFVLLESAAFAHTGEPVKPHDLWAAWAGNPGVLIPLAISAILYWRGARAKDSMRSGERLSFWIGWWILFVALASPVHRLGESLFSAHMIQHGLLMVVAAPLLVLGRPLASFLWALPITWRRSLGRWSESAPVQSAWHGLTDPLVAWCVQAIVLWDWHAPVLFQATLRSDLAHNLQHLSFLLAALLFWWAVMHAHERRMGSRGSVLYLFATALHIGILGAFLTFSPNLWYPAYLKTTLAWGLTPLQDQQLGGLILWAPAGISYLVAGLAVTARWPAVFGIASAPAGQVS